MKFRVDGTIYDFSELEDAAQDRLMKQWHRVVAIECLCQGGRHEPNPLLYVKQVKDGLFFANYPSNTKNNIAHDFKCRYNRQGYRSLLEGKGIHVEENEIRVSLVVDQPRTRNSEAKPPKAKFTNPQPQSNRERSERKVQLVTLFLTMLQEFKITEFRPGGRRNIASRLYKVAQNIKLNGKQLSEILYVADNKLQWPNREKHQLMIGWGRRSEPVLPHPTNPKFVRLPIYSVDDPSRRVTDLTVLKNIFEHCEPAVSSIDGGYYLLFRGPTHSKDKNIWDRQLCFIPAEERITRIPVQSEQEAAMIEHLANKRRHFEKPLIGNVTELFLDSETDIVLHDTEPKTIISIVNSEQPRQDKRDAYKVKGFDYIEWDGNGTIPI